MQTEHELICMESHLYYRLVSFFFSLMQPGDANIAGNVHGGSILKMIEEAGLIVSTRHCNHGSDKNVSSFFTK